MFQVNTGAILETYLYLFQIQTDQISFYVSHSGA